MAEESFDLSDCVKRTRRGDEAAARELVERLQPLVQQIVRSHLPARSSEADLAQEVFIKLLTRLDRYQPRPGVPFTHWASRLALRTCLDALRAERRRPEIRWSELPEEQALWLEFLTSDPEQAPNGDASAARELVQWLLSHLSPQDRLVLTLLDLEERSVREISSLTGWSVPGVKVRAFRARHRLRRVAIDLKP